MKEKTKDILITFFNLVVIFLNIGALIWLRGIINLVYPKRFTSIYLGEYCIVPFSTLTALMAPSCIIIFAYILYKLRYIDEKLTIGKSIALIPVSLVITAFAFITLNLLPPFCSKTNDIDNYLLVDERVQKYSDCYNTFFPTKVPESAENIKYQYKEYEGFFSQEFSIQASWSLSDQEYLQAKEAALKESASTGQTHAEGERIIISELDKRKKIPQKVLQFDDQKNWISYSVYFERDI